MPKLPKGLFRRKPGGRWYLRLHRGGRDRWVSLGSDFRRAVRRAEELRSGVSTVLGGRVTAGQASQRWLEVFIQTRRNPKGQKMTEGRVRQYFEPFMGHLQGDRVTSEDFRAYRLWLERSTKLSPTSVSHLLADCRCMFNWCEEAGLVTKSPFRAG